MESSEPANALDFIVPSIDAIRWDEKLAQDSYPQVALLKQIKGVGTLIALTFLLTLEDPHRFRKSRDVGCYLGLQPGRRNSGQSEPQMHISKEGDPYLRTLLVQCAQHRQSGGSTGCNENAQLAPSEKVAHRECGWKDGGSGDSAGAEKPCQRINKRTQLTPTGLLM